MNGAYLHIATNHIPVVGIPLVTLLLAFGWIKKSREVTQAALVGFILLGAINVFVFKTGGPAAHVLFHSVQGIERAAIHEHAEAADWGIRFTSGLAVLSIIAWVMMARSSSFPSAMIVGLLLLGIFVSVVLARVAHLGGLIRHTEISSTPVSSESPPPASPAPAK